MRILRISAFLWTLAAGAALGENQICKGAQMSRLSEYNGLKGMRVRLYLDNPWDLVTIDGGPGCRSTEGDSYSPLRRRKVGLPLLQRVRRF
jgi:hypothetical protein